MSRFGEGARNPFSDTKTLLIGTIIGAIPIVGILLTGYFVKSLEKELKGGKPVSWTNFPDLIVKALLGLVITLIYSIPAALVLLIAGADLPVGADYFDSFSLALASGNIVYYIGLALLIVTVLVIPMALVNYAKEGKFTAAFQFSKVFKKGVSGPGIIALILSLLGMIILGLVVVSVLLTLLTFLGGIPFMALLLTMLASGFLNFCLVSAMSVWYAKAFKEAK